MFEILAAIGCVLAISALVINARSKRKNYKAICDLGKHVSCSRAFSSPEGTTLGVHNAFLGLAFYLSLLLIQDWFLLTVITGLGVIKTLHLAYVSYFKMKNFCVVCTATYVINILLFLEALMILRVFL